jgi:hypothetical protein
MKPSKASPDHGYVLVAGDEEKAMGVLSPGKTPQLAGPRWISLLLLFAICFFLIGGFLGFEAGNALRLDVIYDVPCTLRALRSLIPDSGIVVYPHLLHSEATFHRFHFQ